MSDNGQTPAFPTGPTEGTPTSIGGGHQRRGEKIEQPGLTKREWVATHALYSLRGYSTDEFYIMAKHAVELADALLAELDRAPSAGEGEA